MEDNSSVQLYKCTTVNVNSISALQLIRKGRNSSNCAAKDQSVDIMSPLVRVDCLQIHHVTDDVVLVRDAVPTEHVTGHTSDFQGLSRVVPFDQRNHLRSVPGRRFNKLSKIS